MAQFIYVLEKARKSHGDKVVLDDVTLAFLPGAKIGVVGPNGAGKSSLLRIMAGRGLTFHGMKYAIPVSITRLQTPKGLPSPRRAASLGCSVDLAVGASHTLNRWYAPRIGRPVIIRRHCPAIHESSEDI